MTENKSMDVAYCMECKQKENDLDKLITCFYCFSNAHFKCRNIIGSAINKLKRNMYFCTAECSNIYKRIIDMQTERTLVIDNLSSELKKSVCTAVSVQMNEVKAEVATIAKAIEDSQQFLSSKFEDIVRDFQNLKVENCQLRSEVDVMKRELSSLKCLVNQLECNADKVNKESLSNNAIIHGIPVQSNENVSEIVTKVSDCIGAVLPPDSLVSASRVFVASSSTKCHVPIRIVFKSKAGKESFLASKRRFGRLPSSEIVKSMLFNGKSTYVTIRDELTPLSLELLNEVRNMQAKMNLKYVWAGREGAVLVKKDESSRPTVIKNRNDLKSFVNGCPSSLSPQRNVSSKLKVRS